MLDRSVEIDKLKIKRFFYVVLQDCVTVYLPIFKFYTW